MNALAMAEGVCYLTVTMLQRLGRRIQTLRDQRKMTQEQLAAKTGLSRGYLARLETGRHDPSATTLAKIALALRVPISSLFK
jgi:transcriptional regulator with XRE-family HTH domain